MGLGSRSEDQIEPEDEGDVLLKKIAILKQTLEREEQKRIAETTHEKEVLDTDSSTTDNLVSEQLGEEGSSSNASTTRNLIDAYILLEEKYRESREQPMVSETAATTPNSNTSRGEDIRAITKLEEASSYAIAGSRKQGSSGPTAPPPTSDVVPTVASTIRRGQPHTIESEPGAVPVSGVNALDTLSRHETVRIGEAADEENRGLAQEQSIQDSSAAMLIEANLVDGTEDNPNITGPLVTAKRDSWYRRNQWWLAGAFVVVVVTIILSVVLTNVDLRPAPAPTFAPTTPIEGAEAQTEAIILQSFPAAAESIADDTSSQAQSLRWVAGRKFDVPGDYSDLRVLQQYALAALFIGTAGESTWLETVGWLNGTNECTWYGVTCDPDNAVLQVSLSGNNMTGTIPPDLSILSSSLSVLDLSGNLISGSLPIQLGSMFSFTEVILGSNRLSGTIPSSIEGLVQLQRLDLSSNSLTGFIPIQIEDLLELRSINLGHNALVGAVPSEIGHLSQLEFVNFESNALSFVLPSSIGRLSNLELLDIRQNSVIGPLPSELGSMTSLQYLDLSENLVFGTIPTQIVQMSNLISIDLSLNLHTGPFPDNIGLLRRLTSLSYSDNSLSSTVIPDSIFFLSNLEHLEVGRNRFITAEQDIPASGLLPFNQWDAPLASIGRLTNLITLDLSGMKFTESVEPLGNLTNLEVLNVAESGLQQYLVYDPGGPGLLELIPKLSSLREIYASNSGYDRVELPGDLALATRLEVLDFHGNLFHGTIPSELGALTRLSVLNLGGSAFNATIPAEIFGLSNLNVLDLAPGLRDIPYWDIPQFQSAGLTGSIPSTIGQMTSLKVLNLAFTQISGTLPFEIGMTQLEELNLTETAVSGSITNMLISLSQLRILDIHGTYISGLLLPESLGTGIEMLDISSTLISGSIPSTIWFAPNLVYLSVGNSGDIYGSIPSNALSLPNLETLVLMDVNLTGSSLPTEMGSLLKLKVLDLSGTSLNGSIPAELFKCTLLTSLRLVNSGCEGTIPSEIGLTTNLVDLRLSDTMLLTGSIPAELGNLLLLENLELFRTQINGTIPVIAGRLQLLENIDFSHSDVSGTIPSQFSGLANLERLVLSHTKLSGLIPSELGILAELRHMVVSFASLSGTIPLELGKSTSRLAVADFRGNDLTGSIPPGLCEDGGLHSYGGHWSPLVRAVFVDCDEVDCWCCKCLGSTPPTLSLSPSTSRSPASTPSVSGAPSGPLECKPFASIADIGQSLFSDDIEKSDLDVGFSTITLPFPFKWLGQIEYSTIHISPNGELILGEFDGFVPKPVSSVPVGVAARSGNLTRIALAHANLKFFRYSDISEPQLTNAYYATIGNAFVVSYEGVNFYPAIPEPNLHFQVALYPDGNIEMRWGEGFFSSNNTIAAGIEDEFIAIPVTGPPFSDDGLAGGTWPSNQCRNFIAAERYGFETAPPSVSSSPSMSPAPTVVSLCSSFSPIAKIGTAIFTERDEGRSVIASLPFPFKWRGLEVEYSSVYVSPNGKLSFGEVHDIFDDACCDAYPIEYWYATTPRIAMAQNDLVASAFFATIGDAFVISFESANFWLPQGEGNLNFQAALYADGRVELRWGEGDIFGTHAIASGLGDDYFAVPTTGAPFETAGVATSEGGWPTNQCRMFVPGDGGSYTEHF